MASGLKKELKGKLSERQLKYLKGSFDVIGDVAVLEIPPELEKKEKEIAQAVIKANPHIRVVCKKLSKRKGRLRLRKLKVLLGRGTETIHREHGCLFKLDVRKVYFSPREATERQRIASQIKPGERVLVMFSGIGPLAIVGAKKQPTAKFVCVELNKAAVRYADENVKLNKLAYQVENVAGNVRKVCPALGKFDRIIMPLPETAHKYLDTALACSKKGTVIHLYGFGKETALYENLEQELKKAAKKHKTKTKVVGRRRVLPYGPRIWKVCLEFEVQ